ncbi:MAG: bacteriophage abortive infection AbiH family protein [Bacteroidales bacterium]|nr:bacteriophage abortive infection AbiH family protein [Bacteroidales bacterium]
MNFSSANIKHLYIIGNGFDIHHGVNSSFLNFRNWLEKAEPNIYSQLCDLYEISTNENKAKEWWNDFENMLSEVDFNNYVENVVIENYPDLSKDDFRDRDYHAAEYAASDELGALIYHVKRTFNAWIASLDKAEDSKRIHLIRKDSLFITFNYTRTLEELYQIPDNQVLHIHGMVGDDELILGHGKNYAELKEDCEMTLSQPPADLDEEELEDWYSSHYDFVTQQTQEVAISQIASLQKDVQQIISDNRSIWDSLAEVEIIHVFGFSFSYIDMPYLSTIINHINTDKVKWVISAFSNRDREKIEAFMDDAGIKDNLWKPLVALHNVQKYKQLSLFDDL